ncbi:MAG: hypothetical protein A2664_01900 [Candidatus Taylorbacteria bacterium RIFCSPHIGHO2_01_FULL_46_22b]|uniref:Uncharacterized protein n=1 Tax=Candidatus Taylorbacteria bacterium RIFCSPHIGHO2_01_FULL_46_22b TaxID=1802301 RepID=A0A1G2M592_9BACT|nr:MAG: hypothetical protein A2664_01900 [Candidatus Taylorbacteria bacterium RIFCSPHIGHO2_01_FULL_46_22b]
MPACGIRSRSLDFLEPKANKKSETDTEAVSFETSTLPAKKIWYCVIDILRKKGYLYRYG